MVINMFVVGRTHRLPESRGSAAQVYPQMCGDPQSVEHNASEPIRYGRPRDVVSRSRDQCVAAQTDFIQGTVQHGYIGCRAVLGIHAG